MKAYIRLRSIISNQSGYGSFSRKAAVRKIGSNDHSEPNVSNAAPKPKKTALLDSRDETPSRATQSLAASSPHQNALVTIWVEIERPSAKLSANY